MELTKEQAIQEIKSLQKRLDALESEREINRAEIDSLKQEINELKENLKEEGGNGWW